MTLPDTTRPAAPAAFAARLLGRLEAAAARLQSPFLLLVRLYWGWQFALTGWGKLHGLGRVTAYFASLGIPFPALNAPMVSLLEFAGGILLALGLGARPIAMLLAADMLVAYWAADRAALAAVLRDPGTFYAAAPFTFLSASLLVALFGPGWISLDRLLERLRRS